MARAIITEKNVIEYKGKWFTLLQLSEKHLRDHPQDVKLIGKQFKILNRVFFVSDVTGKTTLILFGAKVQFNANSPRAEEKLAIQTSIIL